MGKLRRVGRHAVDTVQLWTIPFGSHAPPLSPAFADAVFDFLTDYPKE